MTSSDVTRLSGIESADYSSTLDEPVCTSAGSPAATEGTRFEVTLECGRRGVVGDSVAIRINRHRAVVREGVVFVVDPVVIVVEVSVVSNTISVIILPLVRVVW